MGLIGGGPGSFIGPVHRLAAEMDRRIELVAGAFSSDPARSLSAGRGYGIDPARAYPSVEAMIAAERDRADGIEMVIIATPNHLHLPAAKAALEAGLAVMSDKPATATLAEAEELAALLESRGGLYGLTFTYTGYPMVREARARVAAGEIGPVRKVVAEYFQGWLSQPIEQDGNKQASWRTDPKQSGQGGCIGDIGVHAFNLAEFVAGDRVAVVNADLAAIVPGRTLDDDMTVSVRFAGGARGVLCASQVATGERNNLTLRIYGEKGMIRWSHEAADRLIVTDASGSDRILWGGSDYLGEAAKRAGRIPTGHPEGFLEAFANLYSDFAALHAGGDAPLLPGIDEGLRSMRFVSACVEGNGKGWVKL